jgi:hypothetical protein
LIYVEYIDRDRHVPIEVFRHMGDQSQSWVEPDCDRMILQLGRTLRFGPDPAYLAFWRVAGLDRLDAWEDYFSSPAWHGNDRSQAMHRAIHIQRAGLYDELIDPAEPGEGLHAVEFIDAPRATTDAALREHIGARARRHTEGSLDLLLRRVGVLGPDPAHLAVWTFPSYVAMGDFLRDDADGPGIRVAGIGIYRALGEEIL